MTPETPSERFARLEEKVRTLELFIPQITAHMVRGNKFFDQHEKQEEVIERVQSERHRENQQRLDEMSTRLAMKNFWIAVASLAVVLASLIVAIATVYVMVRMHANADIFKLFSVHSPEITAQYQSRY